MFFLYFASCVNQDIVKDSEAYTNLLIAILYKASVCNQQPSYVLILPKKLPRRWYEACIFSIIRMDCPFEEYPIICYKIYEKLE